MPVPWMSCNCDGPPWLAVPIQKFLVVPSRSPRPCDPNRRQYAAVRKRYLLDHLIVPIISRPTTNTITELTMPHSFAFDLNVFTPPLFIHHPSPPLNDQTGGNKTNHNITDVTRNGHDSRRLPWEKPRQGGHSEINHNKTATTNGERTTLTVRASEGASWCPFPSSLTYYFSN